MFTKRPASVRFSRAPSSYRTDWRPVPKTKLSQGTSVHGLMSMLCCVGGDHVTASSNTHVQVHSHLAHMRVASERPNRAGRALWQQPYTGPQHAARCR